MGKTTSSIRTNLLWEGAISFGYLPAVASEDPKGAEQVASENSHPGPKETSFLEKSPLALTTKGATGGNGISLSSPKWDNKGPS